MNILKLFKQYPSAERKKQIDAFLASLSDAERKAWRLWYPDYTVEHIHLLRRVRGKPFCVIKGGLHYRRPVAPSPYHRGPQRPNGGGRAA